MATFDRIQNPPLFSVGELVYLRASAERGFLESYKVDEIRHSGSGYKYFLQIKPKHFNDITQTVGDRNSLKQTGSLKFKESELINVCDALTLKLAYHQNQVAIAEAEITRLCDSGSGSGSE